MIPWLPPDPVFPPLETALAEPNGPLAASGDLSPPRLLAAYSRGIFPWYAKGEPILWWSPDPRMVLFRDQIRISRSLAKTLHHKPYDVRLDTAFDECVTIDRAHHFLKHPIDYTDMEMHVLVQARAEAVDEGHRGNVQRCLVYIRRTRAAGLQALRNHSQKNPQHHVEHRPVTLHEVAQPLRY